MSQKPQTRLDLELDATCEDCGGAHGGDRHLLARCHPTAGVHVRYSPDRGGVLELTCNHCQAFVANLLIAPYEQITSPSQVRTRGQRRDIAQPMLDMLEKAGPVSPFLVEATFARIGQAMAIDGMLAGSISASGIDELVAAAATKDVGTLRALVQQWIDRAPEDGHVH